MITIHDNRNTGEYKLKDIGLNEYFMYCDVLCRRVKLSDSFHFEEDGIPFIEIPFGSVSLLDRMTWVEPIRDEQINVSIEDWG